ncbi:MAG: GSCFA domain-containing protein [Bacteroidales bacterium]|nr:GSCFA domain-containing protein [Bacteroidales bacterium]MCD8394744.1 GSCFA domain-containing protein [Bacteroidales bacterium]
MEFRTVVELPSPAPLELTHASRIVAIGSCFAEAIGDRLRRDMFKVEINPTTGVLYNPASIAYALKDAVDPRKPYDSTDLVFNDGLWHSWWHHSSFSSPDKSTTLSRINQAAEKGRGALLSANILLITFGTTRTYWYKNDKYLVANCHKFPASTFDTRDMDIKDMVEMMQYNLGELQRTVPRLKVILTVSPVRYRAFGFVDNARHKARLLEMCHQLTEQLPFCSYFPAFEIMMDDLRDYRFYDADMAHPSDVAREYIYERFSQWLMPEATRQLAAKARKITAMLQHRPLNDDPKMVKATRERAQERLQQFIKENPILRQ